MKHIFDDTDKNKYEALDKAETLAAIQQIIEQGEIPSTLLNGVALTLRNPIDDVDYKIAFCTQAKYNELEQGGELESNCYYYITDDTSWDDFLEDANEVLEEIQEEVALLPRTQELMRSEASEGATELTLNEVSDPNNWVEVSGYVREDTTPTNCYYFSQKLKIQDVDHGTGLIMRGQSSLYLSDNDDIIVISTRLTTRAASSWDYSKLNISQTNQGVNPSSKTYVCKILSVKELINY